MIRFILKDELHEVDDVDPNTTVLQYLREHLHKTGTKEGCASGDCGACTVVVAEPQDDGALGYKTLNSCIALLPTLHGKQILTVEDLQSDGKLHPVQREMVDNHGSQCGFCTPGFIMSMFALRKTNDAPNRDEILEGLAGNLCRCTGYRPIVDAAKKMYDHPLEDQFTAAEAATAKQLAEIAGGPAASLTGAGRSYFAPRTAAEMAALLAEHPGARILAGGTDLNLEITQLGRSFETIIYTGDVAELSAIEETDDTFRFGAGVSYAAIEHLLAREFPDLGEVLERLGSPQIRNVGTLGGNIGNASPIGDTPPALIVLGATLTLQSASGTRSLPIEEYFLDYKKTALQPGEFIAAIEIPRNTGGAAFRMYKISKRFDDDISAVCGAFIASVDGGALRDVRIGYGGMAAIPKRATNCEAVLEGQPLSEALIERAAEALAQDFSPIDDVRASADYRLTVAQNLLRKYALELTDADVDTRVISYA